MCTEGLVSPQHLWRKLFCEDAYKLTESPSDEFFGPIFLLNTAIYHLNELAGKWHTVQDTVKRKDQELESKDAKLDDLREQLLKLQASYADKTKQLADANQKAKNAQKRVDEIAKILTSAANTEPQSAALFSQLALETPKLKETIDFFKEPQDVNAIRKPAVSPKRKKLRTMESSFRIPESPEIPLGRQTTGAVIPATELQKTPEKIHPDIISSDPTYAGEGDEDVKPTKESKGNLFKSPVKLSFDLDVKDNPVLLPISSERDEPGPSIASDDLGTCSLDQVTKTVPDNEDKQGTWQLKNGLTKIKDGKKLKQTTLAVTRPSRLVDITSVMKESASSNDDDEDDNDLILSSPTKSKTQGTSQADLTFAPTVTSTQFDKEAGSSRSVREKTFIQKQFACKGEVVRGKARANLPGWDCDDCKKYYELAGGGNAKTKMNLCSRHRSKHPLKRNCTPPGFWDVDMPNSQEAKNLYKSICEKRS